jgi:excisionase family DNA binding protein
MNPTTQFEHIQATHNIRRNVLTFAEAWDEVFEKAISKDKLYAEVRAGRIPHAKIGSKILFRRDTLEAWFKQQESLNPTYSD